MSASYNTGQQGPGGPAQPSAGGAPVPDSYFTESRKGEINELRNLLRGFATERDQQRRRDIIKKVLAYMTLGIDVSRLFSEMMMAIETRYVEAVVIVVFVCALFGSCGRVSLTNTIHASRSWFPLHVFFLNKRYTQRLGYKKDGLSLFDKLRSHTSRTGANVHQHVAKGLWK